MNKTVVYSWQEVTQRLSIDNRWEEAKKYLSSTERRHGITLQQLWRLTDQAWDELNGANTNNRGVERFLSEFYQHPVWLINAAFCESDPSTINDRLAAIRLIRHVAPSKVLDFGGGFGTVSRLCAETIPDVNTIDLVDISETRHVVQQYLSEYPKIRVLEKPAPLYDAVVSTEVLEHVIDPIETVIEINNLLRKGGAFSASWSFVPVVKCHLPHNYHLQTIMLWIIRSLGFGFYGFERRGSTVYGFVKHSDITPRMVKKARLLEKIAKFPLPIDRVLFLLQGL
ncbi:MAG: class I SAM-dependent methyltransferase [Anaerolineae bacterium]|nr:class I SAM-dependent methyltransferase [Anaerolineae bacterium]